jgi:glucose/arabinose dehydrogenase
MWWKVVAGLLIAIAVGFFALIKSVGVTPGIIVHSLLGDGGDTPSQEILHSRLQVPDGFSVGLYARNVVNARVIMFTRSGDLLVAQPRESKVSILARDANVDGKADGQRVLLDNLYRPTSIDFFEDYLYISESNAVGRIKFDHETGETIGEYERIITGLGDEGNHWTKTIRFGPDGLLYLSSGSTCNVCDEIDDQRASITRYNPDGSGEARFATGLRNSVGFDWAPFDNQIYATDNGRDLLGDDYPPCELNKVQLGKFYGWPNVNGFGDLDPDFGDESKLIEATSPAHGFRPHNAPLGIRFIHLAAFPDEYRQSALAALHGSWNRSSYDGYKVVSLHRNSDGSFEEKDFLAGFEKDGNIIGRPADVTGGPDDCAYISDDYGMAIYRVCYGIEQEAIASTSAPVIQETGLEGFDKATLLELQSYGEQLFRTRGCLACHVVTTGDAPFGLPPLKEINKRYTLDSLSAFYKTPTPPMPPAHLNEEDQLALSAYLLGIE